MAWPLISLNRPLPEYGSPIFQMFTHRNFRPHRYRTGNAMEENDRASTPLTVLPLLSSTLSTIRPELTNRQPNDATMPSTTLDAHMANMPLMELTTAFCPLSGATA